MDSIEIKITIPASEYETWPEFSNDGIKSVKQSIRKEIRNMLDNAYIRSFEINVTHNTQIK